MKEDGEGGSVADACDKAGIGRAGDEAGHPSYGEVGGDVEGRAEAESAVLGPMVVFGEEHAVSKLGGEKGAIVNGKAESRHHVHVKGRDGAGEAEEGAGSGGSAEDGPTVGAVRQDIGEAGRCEAGCGEERCGDSEGPKDAGLSSGGH